MRIIILLLVLFFRRFLGDKQDVELVSTQGVYILSILACSLARLLTHSNTVRVAS